DPDTAATTKSRDQEWKRARGAIACAECRRLKLKCDKTVPCTSCKRRGCASICPNGALVTGQGTRFVLADTDRLHAKITEMSERIRQLESALEVAHTSSTSSSSSHPLLKRDLLKVKSIIDLHAAIEKLEPELVETEASEALDIFGTLAVREDGASTFYGRSAGQERGTPINTTPSANSTAAGAYQLAAAELPRAVTELAGSFPDSRTQHLGVCSLESYLPPWDRASALCALYLYQAPWFFGAVRERQLNEELLPLFYGEADARALGSAGPLPSATPHDLALLFVILCYGSLVDDSLPAAPDNPEAERYYLLTRAALALDPVTDQPPSVSTVQALSLMGIYQGLVANEHSIEKTWTLFGMATKLAQSVHRDCARWKLSPAEVQKRRSLFWELFITDCWQGLATGRLATFSLPYVDCELPQDADQIMADDGTPQDSFPHWKACFGKQCVSEAVAIVLTARPPKYARIVELDRLVRDKEVPRYAQEAPPPSAPLSVLMQHMMPQNYRNYVLLYIHRAFFAQGLCDFPGDPLKSPYAPSIMAGYRSACEILSYLRRAFEAYPVQVARYWILWTHSFSGAVMLALIPVRAPLSKMAHTALLELQQARDLFEKAAPYGGRAVKMAPVIRRHLDMAASTFHTARSQATSRPPPEIFPAPSQDEFSVFSGVTSTVTAPARSQPARHGTVYSNGPNAGNPSGGTPAGTSSGELSTGIGSSGSGSDRPMTGSSTSASLGSPADSYQAQSVGWPSEMQSTLHDQLLTFDSALDAQLHARDQSWPIPGELDTGAGGQMRYVPPPANEYVALQPTVYQPPPHPPQYTEQQQQQH
ncbi:fungal-specific transcription factor domain-containing protein, partial [Vararia minispora EC-137]